MKKKDLNVSQRTNLDFFSYVCGLQQYTPEYLVKMGFELEDARYIMSELNTERIHVVNCMLQNLPAYQYAFLFKGFEKWTALHSDSDVAETQVMPALVEDPERAYKEQVREAMAVLNTPFGVVPKYDLKEVHRIVRVAADRKYVFISSHTQIQWTDQGLRWVNS